MVNQSQFGVEIETAGLDGPDDRVEVGPGRSALPTGDHGLMGSQPSSQLALSQAGADPGLPYQVVSSHRC